MTSVWQLISIGLLLVIVLICIFSKNKSRKITDEKSDNTRATKFYRPFNCSKGPQSDSFLNQTEVSGSGGISHSKYFKVFSFVVFGINSRS